MNICLCSRSPVHLHQQGFSLVELMIAITVSLLLLAMLSANFVYSSRARSELERTNQQIESGRYALQVLNDDLQHAGFFAQFRAAEAEVTPLAALPSPCDTALANLRASIAVPVQGYDNSDGSLACLTDVKSGTDVLVIRHVSTCARGSADCNDLANAPYFQASLCNTELATGTIADRYRLDTNLAALTRTRKDCLTPAEARRLLVHIYFIANNDRAGDGIPTLKRTGIGADNAFSTVSISAGIENMQLEYGIDADGNGSPDAYSANPGAYGGCTAAACVDNWQNITAIKLNLLARNTTKSSDFEDTKTYVLGLNASGNSQVLGPFNDGYRRHAYQTLVRLINVATRRE